MKDKEWKPDWAVKDKDMNHLRKAMIEINEMGDPPIPLKTRIKTNKFYIYFTKGFIEWICHWRTMPFLMMWCYGGLMYIAFMAAEFTKFMDYCGVFG